MSETKQIILALPQTKAAKAMGVTDRTLRNWEKAGLIVGTYCGGVKLYPVSRLKELAGIREEVPDGNAQ